MKNYAPYMALLIILLASSCQHKVDGVILDKELEPYWTIFQEEAAARGIVFDNAEERIEGYIQNVSPDGVIGACQRNENNANNRATFFDRTYWESATDLEKEYVVFHELGHCFLLLDHDDSADSGGSCISIMASGLGGCVENYNSITRDTLIDRLFAQ